MGRASVIGIRERMHRRQKEAYIEHLLDDATNDRLLDDDSLIIINNLRRLQNPYN